MPAINSNRATLFDFAGKIGQLGRNGYHAYMLTTLRVEDRIDATTPSNEIHVKY